MTIEPFGRKKVKMTLEHVGLDFKQNKGVFHALEDVNLKVYDRDFICLLGDRKSVV